MTDEEALIAAYVETPDEAHRLVLADFFDERGDPRGAWLRDAELAAYMPRAEHPALRLVANLARSSTAGRLLVRVGPSAVPYLWHDWRLWPRTLPANAAAVVRDIRESVPGLAALCERLTSDDAAERLAAVRAVGDLGEPGVAALPELLARLADASEDVPPAVVSACGKFGWSAPAALRAVWFDPDSRRLSGAVFAECERLGPTSDAVSVLVDGVCDPDPKVRGGALEALGRLGNPAARRVLAAMRHARTDARQSLASALAGMVPEALAYLLAVSADTHENANVRAGALIALMALADDFRTDAAAVIRHLFGLIRDPDAEVGAFVRDALAIYRPLAPEVRP